VIHRVRERVAIASNARDPLQSRPWSTTKVVGLVHALHRFIAVGSMNVRTVAVLMAGSLALAGCLFPSLDGLGGGANGEGDSPTAAEGADGGSSSTDTIPSSQTTPSGTSSSSSSSSSSSGGTTTGGAVDATAPDPRAGKIECGANKFCTVGTQFCCPNFDNADCIPASDIGFCESRIRCDGPEDCPNGKVCCRSGMESTCATSCAVEDTLCHDNAQCPTGKSCTKQHRHNSAKTSTMCQ